MGIDIRKFEAAKNKARQMIHNDAKQDAHIIKERTADRNNPKYYGDQPRDAFSNVQSIVSENKMDAQSFDDSEERLYSAMDSKMNAFMENKKTQGVNNVVAPTIKNNRLPKEIIESFSKNYISQDAFNPNMSVLETMGIEGDPLKEEAQMNNNNHNNISSSPVQKIDYELIKNIVEGAVKKYINALGKKMLTENKNQDNDGIKAVQFTGDKFKFVTKEGNLYEAKLTFIKNINN